MAINKKLRKLYINSKLEKFLEKIEMKIINDEEKVKIIEEIIEERPKKAVRFAKEIENPETKINTLESIAPNIQNEHVVEILNTLPSDEMARVIDTDEIVDTLINGHYKNEIIEVLRNANTEKEKLDGIYTFIESLNDSEISILLENVKNEEMKKKIITRKIIDDYKKYGNVLHVDNLIKGLENEEDIIEVVENSVDQIDEKLKEKNSYLKGEVKNSIRSKFFNYASDPESEEHNQKLEQMKLDKIDEYYQRGELNYGGLYDLINRGLKNKHFKAIAIEKYRDKTIQKKDKRFSKMLTSPILTKEQLDELYDTLEERDKFILKYSNGKMFVDEKLLRPFEKNKNSKEYYEENER